MVSIAKPGDALPRATVSVPSTLLYYWSIASVFEMVKPIIMQRGTDDIRL